MVWRAGRADPATLYITTRQYLILQREITGDGLTVSQYYELTSAGALPVSGIVNPVTGTTMKIHIMPNDYDQLLRMAHEVGGEALYVE